MRRILIGEKMYCRGSEDFGQKGWRDLEEKRSLLPGPEVVKKGQGLKPVKRVATSRVTIVCKSRM